MNYCTKCQSIYSEPRTCNCYAGKPFPALVPSPSPGATTLAPWCSNCHGHHIGPCPLYTTCSTVVVTSVEMEADRLGGRVTFT